MGDRLGIRGAVGLLIFIPFLFSRAWGKVISTKRFSTATCIPRRSPIQVLTGLNLALLQLWDENWCIQDEWLLTCANAKILDPIQV